MSAGGGTNGEVIVREWVPLTYLTDKIPTRLHEGFGVRDTVLTCVALAADSIAAGCTSGIIFWFSRRSHEVVRRTWPDVGSITQVAISSSGNISEEILAAGDHRGSLAVFTRTEPAPACIGSHASGTVSPITWLSWDERGERLLLSGDGSGRVLLSKFDGSALNTLRILDEGSAIVQLRFHPDDSGILLISSLTRVAVVHSLKHDPIQVGQKSRRGSYGADFARIGSEGQVRIVSSRPGQRLWLSDCQGTVQQTLMYKDSCQLPRSKMILLSCREDYQPRSGEAANFGAVFCLKNGIVATSSSQNLFLLDAGSNGRVVNCCRLTDLRAVAAFQDELLLLVNDRILIRLAERPDGFDRIPAPVAAAAKEVRMKPTFVKSAFSRLATKISEAERLRSLASALVTPLFGSQGSAPAPPSSSQDRRGSDSSIKFMNVAPKRALFPQVVRSSQDRQRDPGDQDRDCRVQERPLSRCDSVGTQDRPDSRQDRPFLSRNPSVGSQDRPEGRQDRAPSRNPSVSSQDRAFSSRNRPDGSQDRPEGRQDRHWPCGNPSVGAQDRHDGPEGGHQDQHSQVSDSATFSSASASVAGSLPQSDDEELVHASYVVGRSRRINIRRRSSIRNAGTLADNKPTAHLSTPWPEEHPPVPMTASSPATQDFLAELERKDQLLARILQLDRQFDTPTPPEESSSPLPPEDLPSPYHLPPLPLPPPPPPPPPMESEVHEAEPRQEQDDPCEDIYSKYADDDDLIDPSLLLSRDPSPDFRSCSSSIPDFNAAFAPANDTRSPSEATTGSPESCRAVESPSPESQRGSCDPEPVCSSKCATDDQDLDRAPRKDRQTRRLYCRLPGSQRATSMTICRNYMALVDGGKNVYYQPTDREPGSPHWQLLDDPAQQLCVSQCGSHLFRLYKGVVYQGSGASRLCPVANYWRRIAAGIVSMGLVRLGQNGSCDHYLWMLSSGGDLSRARADNPEVACSVAAPAGVGAQLKRVSCDGDQVLVACGDGRIHVRCGMTFADASGSGWQRILTPCDTAVAASVLSCGRVWILTPAPPCAVYFRDSGKWWQVVVNDDVAGSRSLKDHVASLFQLHRNQAAAVELSVAGVARSKGRVSIAVSNADRMLTADNLCGYAWSDAGRLLGGSNVNLSRGPWRLVNCAGGGGSDRVVIWLMSRKNRLHCFHSGSLEQISLPTDSRIVQLIASGRYLWLLTVRGELFIRSGICKPQGVGWIQLSTAQFEKRGNLTHVALAADAAWACDNCGAIYFRFGDNGPAAILPPAWIRIDDCQIRFQRVYAGSTFFMVWAVDSGGSVYARDAVSKDMLIGTGWILVPGIKAVQLAVSRVAVWALTADGSVYYRSGISEDHFTGDVWHRVPGRCNQIAVTVDDQVWALDEAGSILKLDCSPVLSACGLETSDDDLNRTDEDWVLL